MMKLLFYFLPVLCGVAIAVQTIVNGQLRLAIGSPLVAAFISFFIGTVVLFILILITRQPAPSIQTLQQVSLGKWAGGLLGAFFVTAVIMSIQKIPAATLFALIITSQLITALIIDQFGWFGAIQSPANALKIVGAVLLLVGAYFIIKK